MKASLIIPCWNSAATLARCIACVEAQTCDQFEAIFINDGSTDQSGDMLAAAAKRDGRIRILTQENRGVSAARNAGLAVARGTYIFFADPDDAFSPDMLAKGIKAMERDQADYCVFPYREKYVGEEDFHLVPLKGTCRYASNDEIVVQHMSRMFGYSSEHVRAWYAGASLWAHRVQGGNWCCVYRRAVIEKHDVRFDERISLYEDAMFNCAYMLVAQRMTCVDEPLYDYIHQPTGAMERLRRGRAELENKFELLRKRKELDAERGGALRGMYACSCVFSLLEMLKIVLTARAPFLAGLRLVRAYARDEVVRSALRTFPLSVRHPLLAACVLIARLLFPSHSPITLPTTRN